MIPPIPPAVSIVLPTYNRRMLLGRAIRTVLQQTYRTSSSSSSTTARRIATAEAVARLRRPARPLHPTRARTAARRGEERGDPAVAAAPFIAFQDSDDEWLPSKLEQHMRAFATCGARGRRRVLGHGADLARRQPRSTTARRTSCPACLIDPSTRFYQVCRLGHPVDGHPARVPRGGRRLQRGVSRARRPGAVRAAVAAIRFPSSPGAAGALPRYRRAVARTWPPNSSRDACCSSSTSRSGAGGSGLRRTRDPRRSSRPRCGPSRRGAQAMIDVSVCVCTFRRPGRSAAVVALPARARPGRAAHRDHRRRQRRREATAEPAIRQARAEGLAVQYLVEPVRGIARARNRSLAAGDRRVRGLHRRRRGSRSAVARRACGARSPSAAPTAASAPSCRGSARERLAGSSRAASSSAPRLADRHGPARQGRRARATRSFAASR